MNVVHVSFSDAKGGAARSAYRLHRGLLNAGCHSRMLVVEKTSGEDETVIKLDRDERGGQAGLAEAEMDLVHRYYIEANRSGVSNTYFSLQQPGYTLAEHPAIRSADVVNLHWVSGMASPQTARQIAEAGKLLVWTFHDMRQITGGCHFSAGCERFASDCSPCPQLLEDPCELTRTQLQASVQTLADLDWAVVCPSNWLAGMVRRSRFAAGRRVEVIPYGLDHGLFRPLDVASTRKELALDPEGGFLCIGAHYLDERRKGLDSSREVLRHLAQTPGTGKKVRAGRWQLICFGNNTDKLADCGWRVNSFSYVKTDAELCQLYSASNALLYCSAEDNLPNTVMEAMSSGCPVVAFDAGGSPDLVDSGINGYLVEINEIAAAAECCGRLLANTDLRDRLARAAREKACREFTLDRQAGAYLALYEKLAAAAEIGDKRRLSPEPKGNVKPVISFSSDFRQKLLLYSLRNANRELAEASKKIDRLERKVGFWKLRAPRYWAWVLRDRLRSALARHRDPKQT